MTRSGLQRAGIPETGCISASPFVRAVHLLHIAGVELEVFRELR
jgi:hypothetical protein